MLCTDAGPHYATRLTYYRMASHWAATARTANGSSLKALPNGARNYGYFQWRKKTGIEYHSKDKEDQYYSRLDNAVTEGVTAHTLPKANDIVYCVEEQAELNTKTHNVPCREVFTDCLPRAGRRTHLSRHNVNSSGPTWWSRDVSLGGCHSPGPEV